MDFINKIANQATAHGDKPEGNAPQQQQQQQQSEHQSSSGGLMDKLQGLAGGGTKGEKDEDTLDKAIDLVQEKVLKSGPQDNESAAEQAKDRFIADQIRDNYKKATGKDFPIKEKEKSEEEKKTGGFGGLF